MLFRVVQIQFNNNNEKLRQDFYLRLPQHMLVISKNNLFRSYWRLHSFTLLIRMSCQYIDAAQFMFYHLFILYFLVILWPRGGDRRTETLCVPEKFPKFHHKFHTFRYKNWFRHRRIINKFIQPNGKHIDHMRTTTTNPQHERGIKIEISVLTWPTAT